MSPKDTLPAGSELPAAPELSLDTSDTTTVTVTWSAPDNDLDIVSYELRWRVNSEMTWSDGERIPSSQTSFTISDLAAGTVYEVQVRAWFESGAGAWSESLVVTTAAQEDPMAVAPPVVGPGTSTPNTVTVTWTAPQTDLVVAGYELRWRPSSGTVWTEQTGIPSTDTSFEIAGLQSAAAYEIQVRAVFETGAGAWSSPKLVATGTAPPPQITAPPPQPLKMYWVESGAIKGANVDGTGDIETLVTTAQYSNLQTPWGIALDLTARKMYWTDIGSDTISSAGLDGGSPTAVLSGLADPNGIALDLANGHIYFSEHGGGLGRVDLDGSDHMELASLSGTPRLTAIALDVASNMMYYPEKAGNKISKANLEADNRLDVASDLDTPHGIAVDLTNRNVYWTEAGTADDVVMADLDPPHNVTVVHNGSGRSPRGIAVDVENGKVYWVDLDERHIERADLDGSNWEDAVRDTGTGPRDIAIGR